MGFSYELVPDSLCCPPPTPNPTTIPTIAHTPPPQAQSLASLKRTLEADKGLSEDMLSVASILDGYGLVATGPLVATSNATGLEDPVAAEAYRECIHNRTDPYATYTFTVHTFSSPRRSLLGEDGAKGPGAVTGPAAGPGGKSKDSSGSSGGSSWMSWTGYKLPTMKKGSSELLGRDTHQRRKRVVGTGDRNLLMGGMLLHQTRRSRSTGSYYSSSSYEPCTSEFDKLDITCVDGRCSCMVGRALRCTACARVVETGRGWVCAVR